MNQDIDFTGFNFQRPKTVPVNYFTDVEMIHFASSRTRVQLDDGRMATLIRWTTPRRTSQVRVQFLNGNFVTLKKRQVTAVQVEPITQGIEK